MGERLMGRCMMFCGLNIKGNVYRCKNVMSIPDISYTGCKRCQCDL